MPDIALNLLDRVKIASPCTARWEDMTGDEKIRHCAPCNLKVHNFSAMTRDEAERLLARHFAPEGEAFGTRVCAGWYKRADGTAILADCPVGLAKLKTQSRRALARVAALCGLTSLVGVVAAQIQAEDPSEPRARWLRPFEVAAAWLRPEPIQPMTAGVMICPPPLPTPEPGAADAESPPTPAG